MHACKIKYGAWRLLLVSFTWILGCTFVRGQEYSYANYDVKDGLAGSVVYCGVEDKEGFLWFGTETGLSRFDGTHFRNFTTADGLPDNEILRLFVDSKNRIWIRAFRNAISYYWKGKIHNQKNDSLLAKFADLNEVLNISEDKDSNIIIVTLQSVRLFTPTGQLIKIAQTKAANGTMVLAGVRHTGNLAIVSVPQDSLITILNIERATQKIFKTELSLFTINNKISYISPSLEMYRKKDSICFVFDKGTKRTFTHIPVDLNSCSPLNDSLCAINTSNGTSLFNYRSNAVYKHCMNGKVVFNTLRDSEGSWWFLTAGKGVFRLGSFEYSSFTNPQNIANSENLPIFSIQKIKSEIYFGSDRAGIYKIKEDAIVPLPFAAKLRKSGRFISILPDVHGKAYFLWDNGIFEMTNDKIKLLIDGVVSPKALAWFKGVLWEGSHAGVHLVKENMDLGMTILYGRVTALCTLGKYMYVGRLDGLYEVDSNLQVTYLAKRFPSLNTRVSVLNGSGNGILWIATNGSGIIGYRNGRILYEIRQVNGLASDICRSLFIAGNNVWVGTDKGLSRVSFKADGYHINTFTSEDGLLSNLVTAVFVDSNLVYAGTPTGITCFDAHKIAGQSSCRLRITSLLIDKTSIAVDTSRVLEIAHAKNNIRIDYVGISYRSAGNISYRYRLVGLDDSWQTTRETFLSYPSLPSGDYELQVIANNKFGVESEMVKIPFTIASLIWERTWFRIAAIIFIGALIWIFVSGRIRKVRDQNDEKLNINNRMAELEQMALKAQMNPHFIFNSLNSLQHYVIEKDVLGANKFITDFSRLIRLTLEVSTKANITVYEEVSYLTTYLELEKTKFEDKFTYEVSTSLDLDLADLYLPPMILQPYVENSIRHGVRSRKDNEGHIKVTFSLVDNYMVCAVEDNGVGRKMAAAYKSQMPIEYQSRGMTLTAKRIGMLNRGLTSPVLISIEDLYKDEMAAGTRVTIRFPLMQE